MPLRLSLKGFLGKARTALTAPAAQRSGPLTFVVGNESADLDSLCSAVVLAYIQSSSPPCSLHIPLSNIPRSDLALRAEMAAVLRHADLAPGDLLTLSELPDLKSDDTRWLLVDHNALTGQLKQFQKQVIGCVDHHVDEKVTSSEVSPRVIEPCGSCMSLVVEECRAAWDALSSSGPRNGDGAVEDDKLARFAMAPILIDTVNLKEKHKVKEKDILAAEYLKTKIQGQDFEQTKHFQEISAVKADISSLGFRNIFRKDYKEWEESGLKLGISCVVQNFDYLLNMADNPDLFVNELAAWAVERKLDVASVMTTSNSEGEFQRHLLVWGFTEKGLHAVDKFTGIAEHLQLERWRAGQLDNGKKRMAWRQRDLTSTRKQVGPLLRSAMKAAGGASRS